MTYEIPSGTISVTNDDVLMLEGFIRFALDMSGGQANVRRVREFQDRVKAAITPIE